MTKTHNPIQKQDAQILIDLIPSGYSGVVRFFLEQVLDKMGMFEDESLDKCYTFIEQFEVK